MPNMLSYSRETELFVVYFYVIFSLALFFSVFVRLPWILVPLPRSRIPNCNSKEETKNHHQRENVHNNKLFVHRFFSAFLFCIFCLENQTWKLRCGDVGSELNWNWRINWLQVTVLRVIYFAESLPVAATFSLSENYLNFWPLCKTFFPAIPLLFRELVNSCKFHTKIMSLKAKRTKSE